MHIPIKAAIRSLARSCVRPFRKPHTPTAFDAEIARWFSDDGDHTHRLDYELNDRSVVFDCGGYEGRWAADIYCRFGCRIHIFEPVIGAAESIRRRFAHNRDVVVVPMGLAATTRPETIRLAADGSSLFGSGQVTESIALKCFHDYIVENNVGCIDLLKINIEGGEYELLQHMLDTGDAAMCRNIQVQFHTFVPDADRRMAELQSRLSESHVLTYQYPFVWENWERKV